MGNDLSSQVLAAFQESMKKALGDEKVSNNPSFTMGEFFREYVVPELQREGLLVDHMPKEEYTPDEAFELMEQGVFMENGGYTWRNVREFEEDGRECYWGEYWSYGEFPECVRSCQPFTLEGVVNTTNKGIEVYGSRAPSWKMAFPGGKVEQLERQLKHYKDKFLKMYEVLNGNR